MYIKIVFIFFSILTTIPNQQKTVLLLFFATVSLFYTSKNRPFLDDEINLLEIQSNITAVVSLFAGSLYILDINDQLKAIAFSAIVIFNTLFAVKWFFSFLDVVIYLYGKKIFSYCPSFILVFYDFKKTAQMTKFTYNLPCYFWSLMANYSIVKGNKVYNQTTLQNGIF